jgi:exodeoxyribonuclease V alpha subunit
MNLVVHNSLDSAHQETLETLRQWALQGWLRRLDSATADFLSEHDPQAAPAALVAVAMLAHLEGRGHVCLSLTDLVAEPQRLLAWPEGAQPALQALWSRLPDQLDQWVEALTASHAVRDLARGQADTGQPFVLGGEQQVPLLYLRRYWVYEQQVAQAVKARAAEQYPVDQALTRRWLDRLFPPAEEQGIPSSRPVQWQKVACALAIRSGLTVITGGPGTGKTYTAARLLALLLAPSDNPAQLRVGLAAPTGKAAARLRQSIDQSLASLQSSLGDEMDLRQLIERIGKASTVHSLLGMRMGSRQFRHNATNPLDLDVLIVDETSMIHLEMMAALMQAMPKGARLILLGDKDQLASVEAGSVLGDMCANAHINWYSASSRDYVLATSGERLPMAAEEDSEKVSDLEQQTVMLRHSHRFGSAIGALARAVNDGHSEDSMPAHGSERVDGAYGLLRRASERVAQASQDQEDDESSPNVQPRVGEIFLLKEPVTLRAVTDLALKGRPCAPDCYADYLRIVQSGLGSGSGQSEQAAHDDWVRRVLRAFDRFRFLCAVHEGDWGDRAINEQVQKALAAAGLLKPQGEWFAGRPIMVTRNDKPLGVFNGDVGVVLPALGQGQALRAYFLDGDELRSVSVSRLAHVETAFAMTIHKSQGSEFAHTVMVLPPTGGNILTRELVYTAITRARQNLTIVESQAGLLGKAILHKVKRTTGLAQALATLTTVYHL